jgi:hypothetical protein
MTTQTTMTMRMTTMMAVIIDRAGGVGGKTG